MRRALTVTMAIVGCSVLAAALPAASAAASPAAAPMTPVVTSPDPVIQWNRFLLDLQAAPGVQPATVHPTYELAIVHAAIYDAVVSIDRSAAPYLTKVHSAPRASTVAAADAAAHDTLVKLYPNQRKPIDARYAAMRAKLPAGRHTSMGVRVGQRVAAQLLAARAHDRSNGAPLPFLSSGKPGGYQLTPPAFAQPVFAHWSVVKPFTLRRAAQFRPPPPPALTSAKYAAAINEVKALGTGGALLLPSLWLLYRAFRRHTTEVTR